MSKIVDLSEEFWDNRYKNNETGWDIGSISNPLKIYIDQLSNKNLRRDYILAKKKAAFLDKNGYN